MMEVRYQGWTALKADRNGWRVTQNGDDLEDPPRYYDSFEQATWAIDARIEAERIAKLPVVYARTVAGGAVKLTLDPEGARFVATLFSARDLGKTFDVNDGWTRVEHRVLWLPLGSYDIATLAAMARFEMNPGHSDLDDEQPETIRVGDQWVTVPLGHIREAHRLAYRR